MLSISYQGSAASAVYVEKRGLDVSLSDLRFGSLEIPSLKQYLFQRHIVLLHQYVEEVENVARVQNAQFL